MSEALVPVDRLSLPALRLWIAELLQPEADQSVAAEVYMSILRVEREAKKVREQFDEQLLAWLAEHGNELTVADTKLYAGVSKSEKVRSLHAALDSALSLCGGDVDVLEGLLSANALLPGRCEAVFGEAWRAEHFEVTVRPDVKVKAVNMKYLGKGK